VPTDREPAHVTRAREYGWTEIVRAPLEGMELWLGLPPGVDGSVGVHRRVEISEELAFLVPKGVPVPIQERARAAAERIGGMKIAGIRGFYPPAEEMARVIAEEMSKLEAK